MVSVIADAVAVLEPELARAPVPSAAPDAESELVATWARLLYAGWYTRAGQAPGRRDGAPRPDQIAALRAAHADTGRWEDGWVAERVSSAGRVVAARAGRRRLLDPVDLLNPGRPGLTPRPGEPLVASARRDSLDFQPGFWVTHSVSWPRPGGPDKLLRLYWNIDDEGAPELVAWLTRELNEAAVPYGIKCPAARNDYDRLDAAVVFLPRRAFAAARAALRRVHDGVADQLAPDTPPLARRIGSGLALAEDPGGEESFGTKRCRLVAEGVLASRAGDGREAVQAVMRRLEAEGIDPRRPHLEPASEADYTL